MAKKREYTPTQDDESPMKTLVDKALQTFKKPGSQFMNEIILINSYDEYERKKIFEMQNF